MGHWRRCLHRLQADVVPALLLLACCSTATLTLGRVEQHPLAAYTFQMNLPLRQRAWQPWCSSSFRDRRPSAAAAALPSAATCNECPALHRCSCSHSRTRSSSSSCNPHAPQQQQRQQQHYAPLQAWQPQLRRQLRRCSSSICHAAPRPTASAPDPQDNQSLPLGGAAALPPLQRAAAGVEGAAAVPHFVDASADEEPYSLEDTKVSRAARREQGASEGEEAWTKVRKARTAEIIKGGKQRRTGHGQQRLRGH